MLNLSAQACYMPTSSSDSFETALSCPTIPYITPPTAISSLAHFAYLPLIHLLIPPFSPIPPPTCLHLSPTANPPISSRSASVSPARSRSGRSSFYSSSGCACLHSSQDTRQSIILVTSSHLKPSHTSRSSSALSPSCLQYPRSLASFGQQVSSVHSTVCLYSRLTSVYWLVSQRLQKLHSVVSTMFCI